MRRTLYLAQPVFFLLTESICLFPPVAPRGPIAILNGQFAKWIGAALRESLIKSEQLGIEDVIRPPVGHDMMNYSDHDMIVFGKTHQRYAHQRAVFEIEWLPDQAGNNFTSSCLRIKLTAHICDRHCHRRIGYKLKRLAVNRFENCTQTFMPLDNYIEAAFEQRNINFSFEAEAVTDVVSRSIRLKLLDEPKRRLIR